MNNTSKGKVKYFFLWLSLPLLLLLTYHFDTYAKINENSVNFNFYTAIVDTPPPIRTIPATIEKPKTEGFKRPTIGEEKVKIVDSANKIIIADTFQYKKSKDGLTEPLNYHADDSMVIDVPKEKMYLYGKTSSIKYENNNLSAPKIEFDQKTSLVSASLVKDSTGKVISYPYYSQGDVQTVSDTIIVNMKNGKGLTKGTYTKQGEIFVYADKFKKVDTSVFYAFRTRFTTCNLDTPHFAFIAKKAKFINKKWAFTGPVHPEFEGVPLPISLPFGIFPLKTGVHSGLLAPSFLADAQRGLGLEGLGYYKMFSQNLDLITKGSLYSYGSWNLNFNPRYLKKYHYQGNFTLSFQSTKPLDEPKSSTFNIAWQHSVDSKARPGVTFSANVNAGSTKFNQLLPGNVIVNFNNILQSTISYQKIWKNKPYSIIVNANHLQNSVTRSTSIDFPTVAFNVNTQYPFRKKEPTGNDFKWYENIGIGYNGNALSRTSFNDTLGNAITQAKNNFTYGARHSIPITLSLPPLGAFQLAPTVNYEATFYQQRLVKNYNVITQKTDTVSLQKGLYAASRIGFGISVNTRIFGMFGFKQSSRIKAIRHEIRPQIGFNYTPDINSWNHYNSRISATTIDKISVFEGNINPVYTYQRNGGISFNLDNIISGKIKSKSDTSAKSDKKITFLDGLSLNTSYNFLADSFKLAPITLSARTNLFEKINVNAGATFSPYELNTNGDIVNKYVWKRKPISLGRFESANISMQTSFKGGDKNKNKTKEKNKENAYQSQGVTEDEYRREAAYIRSNPAEFADFDIPWNIDLNYSFNISNNFDKITGKFKKKITQSVSFNASANLTEKWKIGTNSTIDISNKKIGQMAVYVTRDLHCWQLAINISPIGRSKYFSINIAPKSPILRDLKINRTRTFTDF
jgi:LPS-assembly protein